MAFVIDSGFADLSFHLGKFELSHLLLMNNADIPWFMLIPETSEVELCDLSLSTQSVLFAEINALSEFVREQFEIDKLNIACNGNVIRQMHWHVIGRRFDDFCWPDVVWGKEAPSVYAANDVDDIATLLINNPGLKRQGYTGV